MSTKPQAKILPWEYSLPYKRGDPYGFVFSENPDDWHGVKSHVIVEKKIDSQVRNTEYHRKFG